MTVHHPVLLQESVTGLAIKADGIYVDGTFGRGGHSKAILSRLNGAGRLIAIDKDLDAVRYARQHFDADPRFTIHHGSFADIGHIAGLEQVSGKIAGILLDLGVSSPQLDSPERGFSFMKNGPLDMRMDQKQTLTAASFVNNAQADEMAKVFREYGEERFSGRIARAIVKARELTPITTTDVLAEIVKEAHPKWEKHKHPATRVFQAIRIHINQELVDLIHGLEQALEVLAPEGRLSVISFHSLEDRVVKQFMRREEQGMNPPPGVPVKAAEIKSNFKRIGKAIKPQGEEIEQNVRARSAVLRIGEKIA